MRESDIRCYKHCWTTSVIFPLIFGGIALILYAAGSADSLVIIAGVAMFLLGIGCCCLCFKGDKTEVGKTQINTTRNSNSGLYVVPAVIATNPSGSRNNIYQVPSLPGPPPRYSDYGPSSVFIVQNQQISE